MASFMTGDDRQVSNSLTQTIITCTNASPIEATTTVNHGFATGDRVRVAGVLGCTAANGDFRITVTSATTFTLDGSTGNGAYNPSSEATAVDLSLTPQFQIPSDGDTLDAASVNAAFEGLADRTQFLNAGLQTGLATETSRAEAAEAAETLRATTAEDSLSVDIQRTLLGIATPGGDLHAALWWPSQRTWVVCGSSANLRRSTELGIAGWGASSDLAGVAAGTETCVAMAVNAGTIGILTSAQDTFTWTSSNVATKHATALEALASVAGPNTLVFDASNSKWIASYGVDTSPRVATSSDMATWTLQTLPTWAHSTVALSADARVAVAHKASNHKTLYVVSTDANNLETATSIDGGVTWTATGTVIRWR